MHAGNLDVRSDGTVVYVNRLGEKILTNEQGSNAPQISAFGSRNNSPRMSHHGDRIAYYGMPKPRGLEAAVMDAYSDLWVCKLKGSNLRKVYDGNTRHVFCPAWSPDRKALIFTDNQALGIVSLEGQELAVKTADGAMVRSNSEVLWLK